MLEQQNRIGVVNQDDLVDSMVVYFGSQFEKSVIEGSGVGFNDGYKVDSINIRYMTKNPDNKSIVVIYEIRDTGVSRLFINNQNSDNGIFTISGTITESEWCSIMAALDAVDFQSQPSSPQGAVIGVGKENEIWITVEAGPTVGICVSTDRHLKGSRLEVLFGVIAQLSNGVVPMMEELTWGTRPKLKCPIHKTTSKSVKGSKKKSVKPKLTLEECEQCQHKKPTEQKQYVVYMLDDSIHCSPSSDLPQDEPIEQKYTLTVQTYDCGVMRVVD